MKKTTSKTTTTPKVSKRLLTWLIFVVDRSGSMESIRADMIGGFNAFIKSQNNLGDCKAFFYQFDDIYEAVFEGKDLKDVPQLTKDTFVPRGSTALFDAVGKTINNISALLANLTADSKPDKVLVVTITDGMNNTSKEFTPESVAKLVKEKQQDKWDFAYIGANQDAWAVGDLMAFHGNTTMGYKADSKGTAVMFDKLAKSTVAYRSCAGASFTFQPDDDDAMTP